ncbi:hypothetical protein PR048_028089 [Dryococelus australis]|uniref:Repressor of the inhibitor of the protein kinase n=1 Tax=Dryococelus australis TaxID=614101 RepID=A0ABQ9GIC0_9NEOP|nr:hypothetical protein PR048_028089 [Dryococelus australis]
MYEWLAYSKKASGGLCKIGILFGRCERGTNNVKLSKLVVTPINTYKNAVETLKHHASTDFRKGNMIASHNFLMVMDGKYVDVIVSMRATEKKKKKLIPIIKTVFFCVAQNIPLRGCRYVGDLQTEPEKKYGEGNFRALLKFRIDAGDEILASHIGLCDKNASYISKTTQNEIIRCCGDIITEKKFAKIKNTKYFTIMADETTDISINEQLAMITNLQKNRSNFNLQTVEEYYRTAVYLPSMDFIINEVSSRFLKSQFQRVRRIQELLSPEFSDGFEDEVLQCAKPYKDDIPCFSALKGELRVWKQTWKSDSSQKFPKSPAEGYKQVSALQNIRVLFHLLCLLPVTANTVERSFSALSRLKTYLWSTMTEGRINGLALLHIHQDIASTIKPEEVLGIFVRIYKRKLSLNFL